MIESLLTTLQQSWPPGLILIVVALPVVLLPHRLGQALMLAAPIVSLAQLLTLPADFHHSIQLFSYTLEIVRVDSLSRIFGVAFHLALLIGVIYALHVRDRLQAAAVLVYAGAAVAAVFAGDLLTLFGWWELTALSSVFLIWASRTESALRAGTRYLVVQVSSGLLLLAGAILIHGERGTLAFGPIGLESVGGWLIFFAFGIKAAFPLLHAWMKDAYPEATVTGTVFLSIFTTKLTIYALARGFAGTDILVPIGATMAAFPIFYAVIENDMRRVLTYSLNSQLGFMVCAVGIGTEFALNGMAAHVFAHVLYKSLLFMSVGAVLYRTGTAKASELGGLYKSMPWTAFFCIIGAISISAFPLTSGFVTKAMILSAASHDGYLIAFLVLLFASAVMDQAGIKVPFFTFFARDGGHRVPEAPFNMRLAMGIAAFFCIGIGIFPGPLYELLPYGVDYQPYTTTHVVTVLQLLLFSTLAFVVLIKMGVYPAELRSVVLDVDWIWRRLLPRAWEGVAKGWLIGQRAIFALFERARHGVLRMTETHLSPGSRLGEPWPTGATAMWAAALLFIYLYHSLE